jgi:hypothetical protein
MRSNNKIVDATKVILKNGRKRIFSYQRKFYEDDIFIVSYPKSGNTWLRFIIANLLNSNNEIINFHNVSNYVPEMGVQDNLISTLQRPRKIKSHATYNPKFSKVIYLIRDPRDVYVSYYHYSKKSLAQNIDFSSFLRRNDIYPCRWHTHVESWLNKSNIFALIKYEDLLEDPFKEISKIAKDICGFQPSESKVRSAINCSSLENMKAIENKFGRPFRSETHKTKAPKTFVRKGIHGDWENYFSNEDKEYLYSEAKLLLKEFRYDE